MGVSRVDYGGSTLIDLTQDTIAPSVLQNGYTAHDASGEPIIGTAEVGGGGVDMEFGTCNSSSGSQVKVVTLTKSDWSLTTGAMIAVKYTYTNTYTPSSSAPVKLNVNSSGEIPVFYGDGSVPTNNGTTSMAYGRAGYYVYYTYNGSYWVWFAQSASESAPAYTIRVNPSSTPTEEGAIWISTT